MLYVIIREIKNILLPFSQRCDVKFNNAETIE